MTNHALPHGPLAPNTIHLCVDMQNVFADDTEWKTPWMPRVLPVVEEIASRHTADTIFTRFIPPDRPQDVSGAWRKYFKRWHQFTRAEVDPHLLDLVPSLARLVPPATVVDKPVYSPFYRPELMDILRRRETDTLIITGAETDVCVLAAVFDAMDRGFRILLVKDALCSSADETHDALMTVYASRFSHQVELVDADAILAAWSEV
ncbi:cysteine hydrolase family protein [Aurantimonas sp. VKM B-3413]|uniref:cysteine hydrolase family protein n=1 Tax=Aurantimonas sp. VKM B-3413 TaxID=2779401 RepID=UPI001E4121A5|nr:cysteine hydrolase [Aurantimonas sp. VKM B-3413]MCB8837209.1 cysteine hydrolase [Aurantimonas sp. VKM B-3413]